MAKKKKEYIINEKNLIPPNKVMGTLPFDLAIPLPGIYPEDTPPQVKMLYAWGLHLKQYL